MDGSIVSGPPFWSISSSRALALFMLVSSFIYEDFPRAEGKATFDTISNFFGAVPNSAGS
jgi:hypothetical protein